MLPDVVAVGIGNERASPLNRALRRNIVPRSLRALTLTGKT